MTFKSRLVSAAARALGAPPSAADLRAQVPGLEAAVERTRAALDEAEGAYRAGLLDEDPEVASRAAVARDRARVDVDRAEARLADLVRRADRAERDQVEAARRKRYDQALAARDQLLSRVDADYLGPARQIAAFIADLARADQLVRAANSDRPEGMDPILLAEADRATERVEERVVSEREVRLWCYPGGSEPLDDATAALVEEVPDGGGIIRSGGRAHPVVRRRFRRVEVIEPQARQWPDALATSVSLPGWRAGDPPVWSPARGADPDAVIAHAERLAVIAKAEHLPPRTTVRLEPL